MMTHTFTRVAATLLAASSPLLAQWVQQPTTSQPSARRSSAIEFVPQNAGLVLFGGSAPLLNGETWLYDGADWLQLTPALSPTPRFGAELVYDTFRGVAVLYGGLASNISIPPPNSDTWEWDGTNWSLATPSANAGPRYQYGACFDGVRGRTVIYGGSTSQLLIPPSNQTWEFDGTTWVLVSTTGNPGPRERPAMCFHLGLGKAVMFGGGNGSSVTDQTWLYDGLAGTWTQVATSGPRPSARNAARMVYDAAHDVCVLYGGQDASGPLSDTWTFDGAWHQQTAAAPTVRDHAMAFLPTNGQVVRFGGFIAAPNTLSNETWAIGTATYGIGCPGSNGTPVMTPAGAPVIGQAFTLDVANIEPNLNLAVLVLGLTKVTGIDLAFLDMPGCGAYASPDVLLSMAGGAGQATWTWPNVNGAVGATLYCQALCLDPTANVFGFTTSNGVFATLSN